MNCEECKVNPASVHIAQMFGGEQVQLHLCTECAAKKGIGFFNFDALSLPKLLGSFFWVGSAPGQVVHLDEGEKCPNCGTSLAQIGHQGRLGCSNCYEVFQNQVEPILRRIHGNSVHTGKVPGSAGKVKIKRQIEQLKAQLQRAVAEEKYEQAAELRDTIKKLEKEMELKKR